MLKTKETVEPDWVIPTLGITLALSLAIGIGFLLGQQIAASPGELSTLCQESLSPECSALRSAVATESATVIATWSLWLSCGSFLVGAGALIGLIVAFVHGQRTIAAATDANRIAIENGQAQARAYVVIQSVEAQLDEDGHLVARVNFQNSGLSPARCLRWLYNARLDLVMDTNDRHVETLGAEPDLDGSNWQQDIPSGQLWTSLPLRLRDSHKPNFRTLIEDAQFIAANLRIVFDYQDVFGVSHLESANFQGRLTFDPHHPRYDQLHRGADLILNPPAI